MVMVCDLCGAVTPRNLVPGVIKICPDCGIGAVICYDEDEFEDIDSGVDPDGYLGDDEDDDYDINDDYVALENLKQKPEGREAYKNYTQYVKSTVKQQNKAQPVIKTPLPKSAPVVSSQKIIKSSVKKTIPSQAKQKQDNPLLDAQEKFLHIGNKDDKKLAGLLIIVQKMVTDSIVELSEESNLIKRDRIKNKLNDDIDKLLEGEATFLELVAIADAINSNIDLAAQGKAADPTPFLTSSAWASLGGIVLTLISISNLLRLCSDMTRSERVLKSAQTLLDIAQKGASATTAISGWTSASSTVTNISGAVGSALGIVISSVNYTIELKHVADMQLIKDRYNIIKKKYSFFQQMMRQVKQQKTGMDWLLYKVLKKVKRRKYRAGIGAGSSAAAVLGSGWALGGTIAGIVGGAACVPVVGWACLGVATVGAFGLLGYKILRHYRKKGKLRKFRSSNPKVMVPPWIKTTGEFNRFRVALFIHAACCGSPQLDKGQRNHGCVWAWILFGNTRDKAIAEAQGMGIAGIMAFIKG